MKTWVVSIGGWTAYTETGTVPMEVCAASEKACRMEKKIHKLKVTSTC